MLTSKPRTKLRAGDAIKNCGTVLPVCEDIHIVPVDDTYEHATSDDCWCCPEVEVAFGGDRLVVHNSYDEREKYETGVRSPH